MKNNFLKLSERFFFNGYLIGKINNDEIVRKLNEISEKFYENKIESNNYYFENQNENQFDLKPNTWSYDNVFFDLLVKTGLIKILDTVTNQNLILTDIRTRIIKKDKKFKPWGYIAPHRDSYYQMNEWKGPKLPSYKLIFYPSIGENNEMLRIFPSSHRKMSRIKNGSLSDRLMSLVDSYKSIYKSNDSFCFFPGTLRHWPLKEKSEKGSLRIIYVFRDSRYYGEYNDNELTNFFIKKRETNLLNNIDITFDEEDLKY